MTRNSDVPYITFEDYEEMLERPAGDLEHARKATKGMAPQHGIRALLAALAIEVQKAHSEPYYQDLMTKRERHEKATIKLRDALLRLANSQAAEDYDDWGL